MRINEILDYQLDHQLDEAMPAWAKVTAAGALGAATVGSVSAFNTPQVRTTPYSVRVDLPAEPLLKADPEILQKMKSALSTDRGRALVGAARAAGLKGRELAQFLAQCAHESLDYAVLRELGDTDYFKKYDIVHNPAKAKRLGNTRPGDGLKYIGRGFLQLTGRDNYERAGKDLNLPLVKHPELVERPDVAAKVAIWFWKHRVHPKVHNYANTKLATKPINSGLHNLDSRDSRYRAIAQMIGVLNWPPQKQG